MDKTNVASSAVMGNFTIQANMPNGKNLTISGYLLEGESKESLDERLDLLQDVTDRQRTRAEIPELEIKRDRILEALGQMKDVLVSLEVKQAGGKKLTSQETLMLNNMNTSIAKGKDDLEKGNAAIAAAKQAGGVK